MKLYFRYIINFFNSEFTLYTSWRPCSVLTTQWANKQAEANNKNPEIKSWQIEYMEAR